MADYRYDPVNNNFTVWQPAEEPVVTVHDSIFDTDLDISGFASGITEDGTPIIKPERSVVTIQNNPEYEYAPKEETQQIVQPVPETQYDPTRNYTTNPALTDNQNIAMQFFINKGLKPHQAAGIVGNLMAESNLNPTAINPNSKAYGIAQWLDRKSKLFKRYGKNPTFEQQLEFVWEELQGDENRAFKSLLNTSSYSQAVDVIMRQYERPSKKEMKESINRRLKYAKSLLK